MFGQTCALRVIGGQDKATGVMQRGPNGVLVLIKKQREAADNTRGIRPDRGLQREVCGRTGLIGLDRDRPARRLKQALQTARL